MTDSRDAAADFLEPPGKAPVRIAACIGTSEGPGRERLRGVYVKASELDWKILLVRGDDPAACRSVASMRVDGAVLYDRKPALHRAFRKLGVPIVEASARNLGLDDAAVFADDGELARLAASHLLASGFKRFAYYGLTSSHQSMSRSSSFRLQLRKEGHALSVFHEPWVDVGVALEGLISWLQGIPKPTGLLASDDRMAERVLTACQTAGIRVPDEVGILGIGNDELMCELASPKLSSISLPNAEIGRRCVEILAELLAGGEPKPLHLPIMPIEVIDRASTDRRASADPLTAAVIQYLEAHIHTPIGTDEVAAALKIKRRTLERRFIAATGSTIHDLLVTLRLRAAKRLLRMADLPLGEIARQCGYLAPSAFTRMFVAAADCHPLAYRKQYREENAGPPKPG